MRGAWLPAALVVLALSPLASASDLESAAFIDTETSRNTVYLGEAVEIRLVIGYEAEAFAESVIQPFQRELDLPVHVEAAWTDGLAQTTMLEIPEVAEGVTIALNDDVVSGVRGRERRAFGRIYETLIVTRRIEPTEAGQLVFPAPTLRFAYATTFREDFVVGRVPTDRKDVVIEGAPIVLTALPLPDQGRPEGFTGAVGAFTVSAHAPETSVTLDEPFALRLRVEGTGNLDFPAPRLADLDGFHVYGEIAEITDGAREFTYDVAVTSADVSSIPAIPFAFFDPSVRPPGYRVAWSDEIPLTVTVPRDRRSGRGDGGDPPEASPEPFPHHLANAEPEDDSLVLPVAVLLLIVIVGLLVIRSRSASTGEVDPAEERVRDAISALDSFTEGDLAGVFAELVAAHLRAPAASVVGPDLAARLERVGASADLARSTASLVERLVAARYGGAPASDADVTAARELARELGAANLSPAS